VTTNATTLSIDNSVGTVTGTSTTVSPTATTTYTLTATNSAGKSVTATTTVTVVPAATIKSFTPAQSPITSGASTALNWATTNATTLSINGTTVTGTSLPVSPAATTTYTLTAANSLGDSVTATAKVTVYPGISSFTASPTSVSIGGSGATLSWTVADATSLSLATTPLGGSTTTTPVTGTANLAVNPTVATSYVLTATNSDGSTTSPTVTIATTPALTDITSFLASQTSTATASAVASTSSITPLYLIPVFASGDTAVITDDQGNTVQASATSGTAVQINPGRTTTYSLTVTNSSTNSPGTQVQKLRVIVGDVTVFSGVSQSQQNSPLFADGSAAAAQFGSPSSIAMDAGGNTYFADNSSNTCVIEKLDTSGNATRAAGMVQNCANGGNPAPVDGNALTLATFGFANGVAVDPAGDIYLGDYSNAEIRMISAGGVVSTPAGSYLNLNLGVQDKDGVGAAAYFATAWPISDVALDSLGELIVAEQSTMRVMDGSNKVTTLAGAAGKLCTSSNLTTCDGTGLTGGGQGTATFATVLAIAIDRSTDTIYLVDANSIRVMTPDKSTATTLCPGAACWAWTVTTWINPSNTQGYQDGSASVAQFNFPLGIARAADGTLFVADSSNNSIRRITPQGVVDTIAGGDPSLTCGYQGTCTLPNVNSPALEPLPGVTYSPTKIAVDPTQNRLIFDVYDVTGIYTMPY
jgi:hypothetical protein